MTTEHIEYTALSVAEWLLAECLEALQLADSDPVPSSFPGVGTVTVDNCCGQLSVAPELIYATDVFPNQALRRQACLPDMIAVQMLTTLARCVPVMTETGRLPTPEKLTTAHSRILEDAYTLFETHITADMPSGDWDRTGPVQGLVGGDAAAGGCVLIETRMTVGIPIAQFGRDS